MVTYLPLVFLPPVEGVPHRDFWYRGGLKGLLCLIGMAGVAPGEIVLYDAGRGTLPAQQGWPFFADPAASHSVTQTLTPQAVVLGIFTHPDMPITDRTTGYAIRFQLRVDTETHLEGTAGDDNGDGLADRAGFSLITISQDLQGLELAFWEDRIWAQDDDANGAAQLFTQAESVDWDTTSTLRHYELRVLGDQYQLMADSRLVPLLEGRVRNYRSFAGSLDPYEIPSFLFLGDNSTRGESRVEIGRIAVAEYPPPCQDVDALVAAIAAGDQAPRFDLTGDGQVNHDDLTQWLTDAGHRFLGAGRSFAVGDANLDGSVDISDFNLWNSHKFTSTGAWCQGDFNADGFSDISDFNLWNGTKFTGSGLNPVPEPTSVSVALAAIGLLTTRGTRRGLRPLLKPPGGSPPTERSFQIG